MKIARSILEFLILAAGSLLAGFVIACIVHYVSFGIWGYGFGEDALGLAIFEGGTAGAMMAIPTGAIIYYAVLKRYVTVWQVQLILVASLGGGLILALGNPVASMIVIPLWTIGVAAWLKRRNVRSMSAS